MGERLHGMQEVVGSIPIVSIFKNSALSGVFLFPVQFKPKPALLLYDRMSTSLILKRDSNPCCRLITV